MRRREFVFGACAAAGFEASAARAQATVPLLGFLSGRSRTETAYLLAEFHRGLAEAGFPEGQGVRIDYRYADGHYERLPGLAAELVRRGAAAIVTTGGNVTALAAKGATSTIPIVFVAGGDPVGTGLVASLNRPGGNMTGVSLAIAELAAKRLELLRELMPQVVSIAVLVNPGNPVSAAEGRDVQGRAAALGVAIHVISAAGENDFEPAFAAVASRGAGALLVANDPFLIDLRERLVRAAAERAVPAVYFTRDFVEAGGLMSYGASIKDGYQKAGGYVGHILKGAKPADLPVVQPTKFELVINMRTAKALGIVVPLTLQAQADEVIE
ncbi:MAG TPA: ABC transporter substrate-binding protein [Beijerinckiaceae bacterium]|nr:ABC transporter substrate-binding protein [Beijerinckiaceae bacterium]